MTALDQQADSAHPGAAHVTSCPAATMEPHQQEVSHGTEQGAVSAGGCRCWSFFHRVGSPQQCEESVRAWRWPKGFVCPRCQGSWRSKFRRQDRRYFQCRGCRCQCSLVSGTVFESGKLPPPNWFLAMHPMTQAKNNVSALELKRKRSANNTLAAPIAAC
ncbi:MAG: hypothetical protein C0505_13250 [Leptothrix sp. (in: Bacteria)]|nr:hypothetical protein [Leptothrix sp. (in: b-proteobacteria)]